MHLPEPGMVISSERGIGANCLVINPDAQSLLSVSVARARLLQRFSSLPVEQAPLSDAGGRVLAQDLHAAIDLPPFANSSMDGFAVRAADIQLARSDRPVRLRVVADIPAGKATERHLDEGEAIRIMTGAPVPFGADVVVPVEHTDFHDRSAGLPAPATVCISQSRAPGDYIRVQGEDVHSGELVLAAGRILRPMEIGFLSMLGFAEVPVHRRARVAIFSTGDELLPVDKPLTPGMIHDANSYTLAGLVQEAGAQPVQLGIIPDDIQAVRHALQQAFDLGVDLILSSAGVSVGAFDFVRKVVEEHGELDFWRVNMRPGKPLAFGSYQNLPFVGLPGNPVSAYIGFLVFVRPAIWKMNGLPDHSAQHAVKVEMGEPVESDGRESYLRAVVSLPGNPAQGQFPIARLASHQGSGNLRSLVLANALLIIPSGVKSVPAGTTVDAWMLRDYQTE
jgi:molybdopterin molybdotransferase